MAQKIWIDNGVNINPAWEMHIAYSFDNITWSTVPKEMLGVYWKTVKANISSPLVVKDLSYAVLLRYPSNPNVHSALEFDLDSIQNQPGWTNDVAGLNQAIADITEWLGQCCGFTAPALATEATAQSILAAIQSHQDIECLLVRDTGNGDLVVQQIVEFDEQTSTFIYSYKDVDGNPYVPIGALEYLDPSTVLNLMLAQEILIATNTNNINTKLTPANRTHNTVVSSGVGSVPAGSLRGSVLNNGAAAGIWNGISLPRGVSIPWGDVFSRDTYAVINFDATGTTFIIEYTT